MNMPSVSIIVPIYNVEEYINRCIDSLINQTLKDIEIILVDDESPDNCPIICDEYAIIDQRIKVIHKKNEGLGFARNSGLNIATGEYVAFVDSDDYVDTLMFEKLYATAKEYSLDTVYCGFSNVDYNMKIHEIKEVKELTIYDTPDKIRNVLLDMIACEPSSKIERKYRMSVWHSIYSMNIINENNIRFYSEREFISEDIIFDINYLMETKKIAFIPDSLYFYCFNNNSLTKTFRKDRFEKNVKLYLEMIKQVKEKNIDLNVAKQRIDRFLIGYTRVNLRTISKSNIKYKEKKELINEICTSPIWEKISDYPINKMPIKHKIIMQLIKYKKIRLLILILSII